jgi:transcriptional regulator with XRE-family HTH domain
MAHDDGGLRGAYPPRMVTRIGPQQLRRNFLRQWRESKGLTQEQLAERVGTYKAQVSNWENAKRAMTFAVQSSLADALGIEPTDLFRDPARPSVDELLRDQPVEVVERAAEMVRILINRR